MQYGIHHSKCYLQKCFETCPIVSNITTNCPKAHCKYLWRNPKKNFTNKSPWGIKTHGNMRTQLSPCEQETPAEGKGEQPLFSPNQKKQLGTHTREPSLWEWTKGYLRNFLSPPTWREQCPRAVISAEAKRMMELHHLPQNCASSGRRVETKLFKLRQIDVKKC